MTTAPYHFIGGWGDIDGASLQGGGGSYYSWAGGYSWWVGIGGSEAALGRK
jgi:hypothetical protein